MSQERLKILLIEHDAGFSRTVGELLGQTRELYAELCTAPDLRSGFSDLSKNNYDVVVLDVSVPDGAGLANISLLKAEAPRLPIIAAGDADNETIAVEAVQAGAQDYLVKSQLTPGWLERSIRYAIERHRSDLALLAAEQKYHSIFDHLVEGIFRTTPDGHYLLANNALARIYGYASPEELVASITDIGRRLYVKEGRRDEFVRLMQKNDVITGFESEIYRKDGSVIWISENCRGIRDAQGQLLHYEGTVEDITQRRHAERDLRNSEALYHSLVETLPQGVFRRDLQGRFTFANQIYCAYHRVKAEDILGKSDFDIYPKDAAEKYWRDDLRVMESGETMEIIEETQPVGATETHYHHVIKKPLYDAAGHVIGLQGVFWDITKEREMEEKLRRSEALYHSLVENSPQNIFRKDVQGRFTFANQQYCKHYNCKLEDIVGKTDFDFFPPEMAEKYRRDDWKVLETGQTLHITEEHQPFGSEKKFVQVVKSPLYDADGRIVGLQGMFWDITAQRLAEERVRKAHAQVVQSRKELHAKNLQMEDDLKMAREIQMAMLPVQYPNFPRHAAVAESAFQFTHRYLPTSAVGGDFFTVSALSDTEASVFICDVAGHGVRSSLVTAMIRALVEELKPLAHDPGKFLTRLNHDLHSMLKHAGTPMLTTAFYLTADFEKGTMRYSNAGHPKPLLARRSNATVEPLANSGGKSQSALGLFAETTYQTSEIKLAPGDVVMLFTDGLYEVEGSNHELYSQAMLVADVRRRLDLPVEKLFDELLEQMRKFSMDGKFDDDVCIVGMEVEKA
jgi:sigma-B regulation protein RsbU (phosphoserine phosphatase)